MSQLSDSDFLKQFFEQTLDPAQFHHRGHLRMAWLLLKKYPLQQAIEKGNQGIQKYANKLGSRDKYHKTISDALFIIMEKRGLGDSWQEYLKNNQDIVINSLGVLKTYYSESVLFSEQAQREFVAPDLKDF